MAQPKKSSSMQQYFKFKAQISAGSVIAMLKDLPNSDFNEPHDGQKSVIEAYDSRMPPGEAAREAGLDFEYTYRTLTVAAGRRWGKSVISSILGLTELLVPNSSVMILAPALSNCEVIFNKIHRLLKLLGVSFKTERVRDMELVLENNSSLRVCSVENASSRLGLNWTLLICDESKLIPRNLITQTLLPMGFDAAPLSRVVYISSPAPGFFETVYNQGQSEDPKWKSYWSINSSTYTNPTIPKEELEEWERTMPRGLFLTEVMGEFTSSEGRVFSEFDRKLNVFDVADYPFFYDWLSGGNTIFNSIDSGYKHFFSSVWGVFVEEIDTIFIFADYSQNMTLTETHANNIKAIEQEWGCEVDLRWGDPAASQQLADLVQYDLYYAKADKNTRETISQTNALFFQRSEVTGLPRLLINKECVELIRQIAEVMWKTGHDELAKENSTSGTKPFQPDRSGAKTDWDSVDALRYGIQSFMKMSYGAGATVFSFGGGEENDDDNMEHNLNLQGMFKIG